MPNAVAGISSVVLYVGDMNKALAFYRDLLGLLLLGPPQGSVVQLQARGCRVVLHQADRSGWPDPAMPISPGGHAITFEVDDPDQWADFLRERGVRIVEGPLDQVWGRVLFVHDPDARVVALARPARRT